jgi:phosphoribosyl 1,2-cyclic phosphodiesterase
MSDFSVTFWGVRGGYPVPGHETVRFGGNTTCLQVRAGPHLIIIDAGTGILGLGEKLVEQRAQEQTPIQATLLFTHGHHDHTQGLSFFTPLRFRDTVIHVFGPRVFGEDLGDMLRRSMLPPMRPVALREMPGMRTIQTVSGGQTIVISEPGELPVVVDEGGEQGAPDGAAKVRVYHSSNHPKGGSLCYLIEYQGKRLVFATDTEGYIGGDVLLGEFVRGVDVLIHDAEYTDSEYTGPPVARQGYGHSTWKMAVAVGKKAQVKRLMLTHHHARHDDAFLQEMEKEAQAVFPPTFMAREGMTIEL